MGLIIKQPTLWGEIYVPAPAVKHKPVQPNPNL